MIFGAFLWLPVVSVFSVCSVCFCIFCFAYFWIGIDAGPLLAPTLPEASVLDGRLPPFIFAALAAKVHKRDHSTNLPDCSFCGAGRDARLDQANVAFAARPLAPGQGCRRFIVAALFFV